MSRKRKAATGGGGGVNYETREMQPCCFDCGRKYGDEYGFPDLVIPNGCWAAISPTGGEGGLLCPSCICRRLSLLGISTVGRFRSGPLAEDDSIEAAKASKEGTL